MIALRLFFILPRTVDSERRLYSLPFDGRTNNVVYRTLSGGYAASLNLKLVLLLLTDTWFDSKLWDGHPHVLLGGASLYGDSSFGPVG